MRKRKNFYDKIDKKWFHWLFEDINKSGFMGKRMFFRKRKKYVKTIKRMIFDAFPSELHNDVEVVIIAVSPYLFCDDALEYNTHTVQSEFILSDNERVSVPYRLLLTDDCTAELSSKQKIILDCLYTRSTDGYIRGRHVKSLLQTDFPDWVFPYILKISDEYVAEILEDVYNGLKDKNNTEIKEFCQKNIEYFRYSHARMISYWDRFYRDRCYKYSDYVGKKLYHECFGYSRRIEKCSEKQICGKEV